MGVSKPLLVMNMNSGKTSRINLTKWGVLLKSCGAKI